MIKARHIGLALGLALLFSSAQAQAQLAPPPQKAPRTPVSKQQLNTPAPAAPLPASRTLEGQAQVLDSSRLRLGGFEVKLFGLVPPQISASYGPQARQTMDALTTGAVTCKIMDRERAGPYLATCQTTEGQTDFGLELLRRGLAVTARGSLAGHALETPYLAAENAAQSQKLGLWSLLIPQAVSAQDIRKAANAQKEPVAQGEPVSVPDQPKAEAPTATQAAPAIETPQAPPMPVSLAQAALPPLMVETPASLLERYQIFATGLLALTGAFLVLMSIFALKNRQKKDELRALAAALRGELMAARAICQARLSKITYEENDKNTSWPRLRVIVFQAYVGRLGLLGAELSRQIASIYGMTSDYASFYGTGDSRLEGPSKKQALETLVRHIEEVTPRLAQIERSGTRPAFGPAPALNMLASQTPRPLSLAATGKSAERTHIALSDNAPKEEEITAAPVSFSPQALEAFQENLAKAKDEIIKQKTKSAPEDSGKKEIPQQPAPVAQTQGQPAESPPSLPEQQTLNRLDAAQTAVKSVASAALDIKAPIVEKLFKLKSRSSEKSAYDPTDDFNIPDYANLTEEELEALLYEDEVFNFPSKPRTKTG
ncbi:MAG: thermonuclease family protein [Alphaproteobacteria bacterium]|nr:thermonuclease family protein [Alphaproteobacteria bacterium]